MSGQALLHFAGLNISESISLSWANIINTERYAGAGETILQGKISLKQKKFAATGTNT
jgi:hypothetical protein